MGLPSAANYGMLVEDINTFQRVIVIVDGDYKIAATLEGHEIADVASVIGIERHELRRQAQAGQEDLLLVQCRTKRLQTPPADFAAPGPCAFRRFLVRYENDFHLVEDPGRLEISVIVLE